MKLPIRCEDCDQPDSDRFAVQVGPLYPSSITCHCPIQEAGVQLNLAVLAGFRYRAERIAQASYS